MRTTRLQKYKSELAKVLPLSNGKPRSATSNDIVAYIAYACTALLIPSEIVTAELTEAQWHSIIDYWRVEYPKGTRPPQSNRNIRVKKQRLLAGHKKKGKKPKVIQTEIGLIAASIECSIKATETAADDTPAIVETSPIEPIAVIPEHTIIELPTDSNNAVDNETVNNDNYSDNAVIKIAFRTNTYNENKRQCVTLEGDTVNLLMLATGIDKQGVPKWVQNAVNEWTAFDDKLPITRQVRRLINRAIESHIKKLESELLKARKNS
jgi:hypothetical protein